MRKKIIVGIAALMLFSRGAAFAQTLVTLDEAISRGAGEIEERVVLGSKVAVLNFNASSQRLSNYVIDEMTTQLVRSRNLIVVERANIELVQRELNFQISGDVSDESAQSIGRMLGAQYIISGSIEELRSNYVVRFRTIAVETAALQALTRVDVRNDSQIKNLLGTDTYDPNSTLVLSAGGGLYARFMFFHNVLYWFGETATITQTHFGPSLYFNADLFSNYSFDASLYYLFGSSSNGYSFNSVRGIFSLFAQFPRLVNDRLTMFPLIGLGYEMFFYSKTEGYDAATRSDLKLSDTLYLKPGWGLKYTLTDNLNLNARLVYDIMLYSSAIANITKDAGGMGEYFQLRHAPSVFVGVSYKFLKI